MSIQQFFVGSGHIKESAINKIAKPLGAQFSNASLPGGRKMFWAEYRLEGNYGLEKKVSEAVRMAGGIEAFRYKKSPCPCRDCRPR